MNTRKILILGALLSISIIYYSVLFDILGHMSYMRAVVIITGTKAVSLETYLKFFKNIFPLLSPICVLNY